MALLTAGDPSRIELPGRRRVPARRSVRARSVLPPARNIGEPVTVSRPCLCCSEPYTCACFADVPVTTIDYGGGVELTDRLVQVSLTLLDWAIDPLWVGTPSEPFVQDAVDRWEAALNGAAFVSIAYPTGGLDYECDCGPRSVPFLCPNNAAHPHPNAALDVYTRVLDEVFDGVPLPCPLFQIYVMFSGYGLINGQICHVPNGNCNGPSGTPKATVGFDGFNCAHAGVFGGRYIMVDLGGGFFGMQFDAFEENSLTTFACGPVEQVWDYNVTLIQAALYAYAQGRLQVTVTEW